MDVADKGEGIVDGQQTLSSALKLRETFISKKRMETPFKKCLFSLMREPKWCRSWKATPLHNLMTDLLTHRGPINIYWQHKYRFYVIKNCRDNEIADGEACSVWFGYGCDNYHTALCAFRGHKFHY